MTEDFLLPPGTRVRYDGLEDGGDFGIAVHCWFNDEIAGHDCYVAFLGKAFPAGVPHQMPYVLRYASASLTACKMHLTDNLRRERAVRVTDGPMTGLEQSLRSLLAPLIRR